MKKERFQELLDEMAASMKALTQSKGEDYSRSDDQLANFKRSAADAGIRPDQVWLVFFNKHVDAIKSFISTNGASGKSEPIFGRIDDAVLYLILLKAILIEKEIDMRGVKPVIIKIELTGPNGTEPTVSGINRNIKAIERAIARETTSMDDALLIDTKSILEGIRRVLAWPIRRSYELEE